MASTDKYQSFFNLTQGQYLAAKALIADNYFLRLRGLLCRPRLSSAEGLYLVNCQSIHMIGMTYDIDALFLNRQGKVVGLVHAIKPGRFSRIYWEAHSCLELPAGTIAATGTKIGDIVEMRTMLN